MSIWDNLAACPFRHTGRNCWLYNTDKFERIAPLIFQSERERELHWLAREQRRQSLDPNLRSAVLSR